MPPMGKLEVSGFARSMLVARTAPSPQGPNGFRGDGNCTGLLFWL